MDARKHWSEFCSYLDKEAYDAAERDHDEPALTQLSLVLWLALARGGLDLGCIAGLILRLDFDVSCRHRALSKGVARALRCEVTIRRAGEGARQQPTANGWT